MDKIRWKLINTGSLFKRYYDRNEDLFGDGTDPSANITIDKDGIRIRRSPVYTDAVEFSLPSVIQNTPDIHITDLALDGCDRLYLLTGTRLFVCDRVLGSTEELGCGIAGKRPMEFTRARGIGIDRDTIYIADNPDSGGRITAFARSNLQIRWMVLDAPGGQDPLNEIIDLTTGNDGIWFIEKTGSDSGRILSLGRDGQYIPYAAFADPGLFTCVPSDIAIDKNGDILVLSGNDVNFFGYLPADMTFTSREKISVDCINYPDIPRGLVISPDGHLLTGVLPGTGRMTEEQPPLWNLNDKESLPWEPLLSYRGSVSRLALDSRHNLYVLDGTGRILKILYYREINNLGLNGYSGTYISTAFDSMDETTSWHRFIIEGIFPPGAQVEFSYSVTDDPVNASLCSWQNGLPDSSALQGESIRDGLFRENINGRFIRFKIELTGTEQISPVIKSVALAFPRNTWLDYLPEVYWNDPVSCDFLERFLSLFESTFAETEFCIDHLGRYMDPAGTPEEFLEWLGSWIALAVDEDWPVEKRRCLIARAMDLYKKRGTREGLEDMIEIYLGERPFVVEMICGQGHTRCMKTMETYPACDDSSRIFFPAEQAGVIVPNPYIFRWDEVPGEDCRRLINYLRERYSLGGRILNVRKEDNKIVVSAENYQTITITRVLPYGKVTIQKNSETPEYFSIKKGETGMIVYEKETRLQELLYGKELFHYYVFVRGEPPPDAEILRVIRNIIEDQRPAHTCFGLRVLEPWFQLDRHTYLGINTKLTRQEFILGKDAVLARNTVLGDREAGGQISYHSGIGDTLNLT